MKVRDIMEAVKDYLYPEETLREAVNKMKVIKRQGTGIGVKGLIVIDEKGNLVGMVSIKEILKAIIPYYMEIVEVEEFTWNGMLEQMAKKVADKKVKEIMEKDVVTIHDYAPLMECATLMVKHDLQRIPVLDENGKVTGIVYVRDLYYAVVKALLDKED